MKKQKTAGYKAVSVINEKNNIFFMPIKSDKTETLYLV